MVKIIENGDIVIEILRSLVMEARDLDGGGTSANAVSPGEMVPVQRAPAPVLVGATRTGYGFMTPDLKTFPLVVSLQTPHGEESYEGYPIFYANDWLAIDMKKNIGHVLRPFATKRPVFTNNYIVGMRASYGLYTVTAAWRKSNIFETLDLADQYSETSRRIVGAGDTGDTIAVLYCNDDERSADLSIFEPSDHRSTRNVPILRKAYGHVGSLPSCVTGAGSSFLVSVDGLVLSVDQRSEKVTTIGRSFGYQSMCCTDDNLFTCFTQWHPEDRQTALCHVRDLRMEGGIVSEVVVPAHKQLYAVQAAERI